MRELVNEIECKKGKNNLTRFYFMTDKLNGVNTKLITAERDLSGKNHLERSKKLTFTTIEERRIRGDLIQYFKIRHGFDF